ncbi:MAG: hypothetical protein JNJ45_02095 [Chthonomonas sp.]|nr:hypothetical protein [Chthonomonas sp.]
MKTLLLSLLVVPALAVSQQSKPTSFATVKVDGPGYFRLGFDGDTVYTRTMDLVIDAKGRLADKNGGYLIPAIQMPKIEGTFDMTRDGWIKVGDQQVGRVVLAVFDSEGLLEKSGNYWISPRRPKLINPAPNADGTVMVIVNRMNDKFALQEKERPREVLGETEDRKGETSRPVKPTTFPKEVESYSAARTTSKGYPTTPLLTIRPLNEVEGDSFLLRDIADIAADPTVAKKLAEVRIGNTPYFGVERKLDLPYLRTMLKAAGFDPTKVDIELAAEAKVVRAGQTIRTQQVVEAAILEAEAKFGSNGKLLATSKPADLRVPKGSLSLRCTQCLEGADGIRVTFDIFVNDRRFNSTSVQLRRDGGVPKLTVGTTVRIIANAGALSVETTGRVTKVLRNGLEVEVRTSEGTLLVGRVLSDGSVEVQ